LILFTEVILKLSQRSKLCADYRCEICGKIETELIAHHIEGILHNPVESADVVNGIALCKECDKKVHSEKGCRPVDLQCK
jgi:predicted restriction endonuclease